MQTERLTIINSLEEYIIYKEGLTQSNPQWHWVDDNDEWQWFDDEWRLIDHGDVICITEQFDTSFPEYTSSFFEEQSLAFVFISSPNMNDILRTNVRRRNNTITFNYRVTQDTMSLPAQGRLAYSHRNR